MIRVRYTFNNAEGHVSWGDCLTEATKPQDALNSFSRTSTLFLLNNLVDLRLFNINPIDGSEMKLQGCEELIKKFIWIWEQKND